MYNQVQLMGRITKEHEIRVSQNANSVVNFSLAINKKYKDKDETIFVNCVAFGKTAEIITQYTGKGSLVFVDGEINARKYVDKNNNTQYITEVIVRTVLFLDKKEKKEEPKVKKLETTYDRPKVVDDPDLPF
jgi:single-strand DNA-binding protein